MIRRQWIYTHSQQSSRFLLSRRTIFFFLAYLTSLCYLCIFPASSPGPPSVALQKHTPASLKRNSSRVAGISDTFRHNRKCRGNVITYRKRHVSIRMQRRGIGRWKQKGNYERDRDRESQIDREREKEKEKGVKRRKGGRKYCKEKRSRRNPFLREKDTYT